MAGSYENEVVAVRWAVESLRQIAAEASPHNRLEIDVHTSSGAFPLTFLDGEPASLAKRSQVSLDSRAKLLATF